jgi:hypothetical protein
LGDNAVAWQWLRFVQMVLLAGLAIWLLTRLGIGPLPAFLAAPTILFSSSGAAAFMRLTLSEPMATSAGLCALVLATVFQLTSRWVVCAAGIVSLSLVMVATKEVLVVCVLPIALLAMCWQDGKWKRPRRSRRNAFLCGLLLAGVVFLAVPILGTARGADAAGYSSSYWTGAVYPIDVGYLTGMLMLPTHAVEPPPLWLLLYPANLIVVVLVGTGLWARHDNTVMSLRILAVACVAFAVIGAVVYLPWPRFESFYALPFYFGTVLLITASVELAFRRAGNVGRLMYGFVALAAFFMVIPSFQHAQRRMARRAINNMAVQAIAEESEVEMVIIETPSGSSSWQGTAMTVARAARSNKERQSRLEMLPTTCGNAVGLVGVRSARVVRLPGCALDNLPHDQRLKVEFATIDWQALRIMKDSAWIDIARLNRNDGRGSSAPGPGSVVPLGPAPRH